FATPLTLEAAAREEEQAIELIAHETGRSIGVKGVAAMDGPECPNVGRGQDSEHLLVRSWIPHDFGVVDRIGMVRIRKGKPGACVGDQEVTKPLTGLVTSVDRRIGCEHWREQRVC